MTVRAPAFAVTRTAGQRTAHLPIVLGLLLLLAPLLVATPSIARADDSRLNLAGPVVGPETLDPAQVRDLTNLVMFRQIFRGLMLYDDKLNPIPEIASRIDIAEDGLTYSVSLRTDATFQDGTPITSDDVLFSLSRAVDPNTVEGDTSLLAGPAFLSNIAGYADVFAGKSDSLSGITVQSDSELTITLSKPDSTFLMKLASVPASIVSKVQVTADSTWWAKPIGSGPYAVDSWEPDSDLSLDAYPGFYGGAPQTSKVDFRLGAASLQSFNLYQAGSIDVDSISLNDIDRVADPNGEFIDQLVVTPQFAVGYIALNSHIEPLDDPWVRAALQLIFPRQEFADVAFDGWVHPANGLIPDQMLGRAWKNHLPGTNVQAARAALAKSRYGSADKVPTIRIYSAGAFAATVLQSAAESDLGLKVEVFDLQWQDLLPRLATGEVPAYESYWASDYPDPSGILQALFGSGQPDNSIEYSNPDVDKLLDQAAREIDPDARAPLYDRINKIICADNVAIPIYTDVDYSVIQPYVHNLLITPMGILRLETVQLDR